MGYLGIIKDLVNDQLKDGLALLGQETRSSYSFAASTVAIDDVEIALRQLKEREDWYKQEGILAYENEFARWNGSKHAFSFMGGRVALSSIIYGLGLQPGDEVLVPGYTCIVVPNAFFYAGIKVRFVDIELDTYGVDIVDLRKKITSQTRAILLQHLFGLVCRDYEAIVRLAQAHKIFVIEDCAHATGALFKGQRVGNLGDAAFYSSEHSKVFTTFNGGMAVTNDARIASRISDYQKAAAFPDAVRTECLLNSFIYDFYVFKSGNAYVKGYWRLTKSRQYVISTTKEELESRKPAHYGQKMPAALALIGLNQLKKIDACNAARRKNAGIWSQWCEENGYKKPLSIVDSVPIFLRYPVLVDPKMKRNHKWTSNLRVPIGVWFITNAHPAALPVPGCPQADSAVAKCINLPTL